MSACLSAGISLGQWSERHGASPVFPENVRGLARASDLTVPYSELAMHTRSAGATVLAWACREDECYVVYRHPENGRCGIVDGLPSEVLHSGLRDLSRRMLGRPRS